MIAHGGFPRMKHLGVRAQSAGYEYVLCRLAEEINGFAG
jgi:hypothetical protein